MGAAVDAARRDLVVGAGGDQLPDGQDGDGRVAAECSGPPGVNPHGPRDEAFGQAAVAAVTTPPKDTAKAVSNVLAPVHRSVVANRRRLTRR